ncbi:sulfite exporter TauE/SafE family protein [Eisenibacter elegans]|uniref:sulfite exporter TauE/SafE family protein n=1 Tax=Eisenibacter elegans TaxID=997 RepID=UPI0003FCB5D9|nr:sulfite exporter TauE/SafE family protein [Eisenibacter elegans]
MMEYIGYIASVLIGISLGLIGGGGSILTVPILVYISGVTPMTATAYSLFVVGLSSLIGGAQKMRQGLVCMRSVLVFGIPSIISVYTVRKYVMPAIPETVFHLGSYAVSKSLLIMMVFAVLMVLAALSMLKKDKKEGVEADSQPRKFNYPLILVEGLVVGAITGFVGAGGGFLIIPALVVLSKLPMKTAVGTSLMIIAIKSLIGFTGDIQTMPINWTFLMIFSLMAIIGIFVGNRLSERVDGESLKKGFGWFVLVMGAYIIVKELWLK